MNHLLKRSLSMIMAILMVLAMIPANPVHVRAEEASTAYVAQIGEQKFESLGEAVAALQDGKTLKILTGFTAEANQFVELNGKKNVTITAAEGAVIEGNISFGYHASHIDGADRTNSTLTIDGLTVNGTLTVCSNDANFVITNNKAAQLTVKTYREGMNITIEGNTADGSIGTAANSYGMFVVPNATAYNLVVKGNTFENVNSHAFVVQGSGDGAAVTYAESIAVTNNKFVSWGLGRKENRAAFKIWADTKYAPIAGNDVGQTTDAMRELANAIEAGGNIFESTASNTVEVDVYGIAADLKDIPEVAPKQVEVATLAELQEALASDSDLPIVITEQIVIPEGKTVTLDLNGKTVNSVFNGNSTTNHIYALSNKGTLTITDTSAEKNGSINSRGIYNYGRLTLEAGAIKAIDGNGGYAVNNETGSTFVMKGGWIAADYEDGDAPEGSNYDATALDVPAGCTATLNGGKITNAGNFTFAISVGGNLNIPAESTVYVEGTHGVIATTGNGTATIGGGSFKLIGVANVTDSLVYVPSGRVTINGGSFDASKTLSSSGRIIGSYDTGRATINGGTFTSNGWFDFADSAAETVTVNGGVFVSCDDTVKNYVAEGKSVTLNGETYTNAPAVTHVAKIGETGYATVQEAIKAAKAGQTITIFAGTYAVGEFNLPAGITVVGESEVVLEGTLKGTLENLTLKNLHIKGASAQRWAYAKGDLVFENVTFEATSVYALHFDGITAGTNLTYTNCTIIGWAAMSGSPASCVFEGCTIKDNGTYGVIRTYFPATIKDCTFDVDGANTTDVYQDGIHAVDATITVNNCTNSNGSIEDILNISGESKIYVDDVLVLAPVVATIGDVEYFTLQNAINAGGEIVLQADVTEEIQIADGKTIVLDLNNHTLNGCFKPFKGNLTVKNGSIVNTNSTYSAIEINEGELTLTDVKVSSARHGIRIDGAVTATINGGEYKLNATSGTRHAVNVSGAANVTIKAGTFVGPKGTTMDSGSAVNVQTGATVTIEGGNFSGGKKKTLGVGGTLTVKGGTFDQDPKAYIPGGDYVSEKQADGTYTVRELNHLVITVSPVATMSTTTITVATMDEAIAYAKANPADSVTYKITGSVELTTDSNHGILDLGNNVIIEGTTSDAKLTIVGGGVPDIKGVTFKNITIADEGTYLPTANEFMYQNFIDCSFANVTFEDGIRVSGTTTITGCTVNANTANEYAIWMDEGNFTMTNTTVTAGNDAYGLLKSDKVDTIAITGNTFKYLGTANKEALNVKGAKITASNNKFIDCTKGVLPADKTNYAEDGTTVITDAEIVAGNTVVNNVAKIGETKYQSLAAAAEAAKTGDEIILLADVTENVTLPAGVIFNGNGKSVNGSITAAGEITFKGHTKATSFNVKYTNTTINIGEGACLEITGTGRIVIGHGCTFNITGTIADAKTADKTAIKPSLIIPGASFTGTNLNFNVTNAYIKFNGNSTSKNSNANGTFNFNVTNSIWEQTGVLAFYVPTQGMDPTFNFTAKDSVLTTTSHLVFSVTKGEIVFDNTNVNVGTKNQIENRSTMIIKNGSVVNGAVATSSNAINPGTVTVENATYAVTGQFSGSGEGTGTLIIKKGAKVSVGSIKDKANIVIDATGMTAEDAVDFTCNLSGFTGTLEVVNNDDLEAKIEDGKIVLVEAPAIMVTYPVGNPVYPEGKVEYYNDMLEAVPYTTNCPRLEGATITLLKDTSGAGLRFMENGMVFDLNGHTYTITAGTGSQGTNTSGFQIRPEVTTNVLFKNGTIKVAEGAPVVWMFNCYATDFIVENVTVDCTNMAWSYGESCYVAVSRSGDNVQFVGNTKVENFNSEVAGAAINVGGTMTIGENVVPGGSIELDAGATLTALAGLDVVTADGYKVVYENGAYVSKSTTIEVSTKAELNAALAAAKDGDTIVLTADIDYGTDHIEITKAITLDLGGKTLTTHARNYGLALKNDGIVVTNGKLNHAGTVAAIKVWNAAEISYLEIDVTGTSSSGNAIGGIVLQQNCTGVNTIKNVKIHSTSGQGIANGIETNNCGNATEPVIGSLENVTIEAVGTAMNISAPVGTATNCIFKGGVNGVELWIKGTYSASLTLVDSQVEGGVYAHDEFSSNPGVVNSGTLSLTVDDATTGVEVEDITLTIARAENVTGTELEYIMTNAQAKVGDTYHLTLTEALAAWTEGTTLTLLANAEISAPIAITESKTLDGNGKTLTYTGTDRAIDVPNTANGANVTIKNLTVNAAKANRGINYNTTGELTVENVTVSIGANVDGYAINFPSSADGAKVTITNSNLTSRIPVNVWGSGMVIDITNTNITSLDDNANYTYSGIQLNNDTYGNVADGTVVNVTGGSITALDEKGEPSLAVSNWSSTGKVNISNTTNVTGNVKNVIAWLGGVGYTDLQAAFNDIAEKGYNSPLILVRDITLDKIVTIPAGIKATLDLNGHTITGIDNATGSFGLFTNRGELTVTGNGTITLKATNNRGWSAYSSIFSNTVGGKLTIENGTFEHLGGTDMAYAIDNLTNGKGTYAETVINGGIIKSTYRAIRQFLNGVEAQNILTVNGGTIEGANKSIWMQDPSKNANSGKLTVSKDAIINGHVYLDVTEGSTAWPVEVSVAASAVKGDVISENVPATYVLENVNGTWSVIRGLKGKGTAADPYKIGTVAELELFRNSVNAGETKYNAPGVVVALTADIDLAGINWNPIGSMSGDHGSFKGVFDGDGHTISNLNVQQAGNGLGLFARTAGNAEIKNLTLNNVTVKSTNNSNYVGAVVGNSYASTKITNVHVTGNIDISGRGYIGGISGHGYVVMDNVSVKGTGTISSTFWCAGGILGYGGEGTTNIMNAQVEGITITSAAGGLGAIVGMAEDNNGTQPISGSNLSAKNVQIKTYTGAYGDAYANYALGYLYGGNETSKLTGTLTVENVTITTSSGEEPTVVDAVASVGNSIYFSFTDAVKAAAAGAEIRILKAGTYKVPTGKSITITGAVDGVVFDNIGAHNMGGASVTFNNVTFDYYPNVNYTGLQHSGNLTYNNCTINGQVFLYGQSETFNNCIFNQESSDAYNVWTYSAEKVEFNECTFNSAGKSVLIYHENASVHNEVTVTESTFKASAAVDGKAAIEMDSSLTAGIKLTIDSTTTATGFGTGNVSGNSLWNNKKGNNTDANNDITVKVGDETVLAPVTFVAKIGNIGYTSIAAAIKAANAGETVTILAGEYNESINVNKAITVIGETDANGNNLVKLNGGITVSGDNAVVKNLTASNPATTGYNCTLSISGANVLVEGCEITDAHAMRYSKASGTVTLKNCVLTATDTWAIHFDEGNGSVVVDGCKVNGWVALSGGLNKVTLKDSTFDAGNWAGGRTYNKNVEISGCTFEAGYKFDLASDDANVTVTNSKMSDGSSIVDLFHAEDAISSNITVDGDKITYVAKIGNTYYATLEDALANVADWTTIKLVADATLDYNAREAYGRASTTDIIIDGQGFTLTLNQKDSDWSSIGMANADGKLTLKNMTIEKTGYGDTTGAWNTHAINFTCNVEMKDVTVNNAIAVENGATLNNVTIYEANGYYGLWISGNGQAVTVNGGAINATNGGRGIKIADEYVDAPASVTLNVTDTKFNTAKKAAVLVTSTAGASITASNVDIENVAADKVNFVWVDEDRAAYNSKVTVSGGTKAQENVEIFVAQIGENYFKTLAEAIAAAKSGDTVTLLKDITEDVTVNKSLTIDGAGKNYTGNIAVKGSTVDAIIKNINFVNGTGYAVTTNTIKSITVENCTVKNYGWGFLYANKSTPTVVVKNVSVDSVNYGFHWVYGNNATLENVTMTNVAYGLYIQNYANKKITLNNCSISGTDAIYIWERDGYTGVQTFIFEGVNTVSKLSTSQYAKYIGATIEGTALYGDLVSIVNEAEDGATVKLLSNITLDGSATVNETKFGYETLVYVNGKDITIDFNGKVVEVTPNAPNADGGLPGILESVIFIGNSGKLTLKDSGKNGGIKVNAGSDLYSLIYNCESTLVIENGVYNVEETITAGCLIYGDAPQTTIIKDGTFILGNASEDATSTKPWIINVEGKNTDFVSILGGTYNQDLLMNYGTQKDCEVHIPNTLTLKDNGDGTWTIVNANVCVGDVADYNEGFLTLTEAVEFAQAGETITLLADNAESIELAKAIVLNVNGKSYTGTVTLTDVAATLTAPKNLDVVSGVETHYAIYENGAYVLTLCPAQNENTGKYYASIYEALAAAKSGETVKLLVDGETETLMMIGAGVTLNLNGHTVTAGNVFSFGDIIDNNGTTDGKGGIIISNDRTKAFVQLQKDNDYLPLYDAADGCYRFYSYSVALGKYAATSNTIKFKFNLRLSDKHAYELLADAANSGIEITARLQVTGLEQEIAYKLTNEFVKKYADAALTQIGAGKAPSEVSKVMELTVSGLGSLASGTTITFIAEVESETGMTYEHNVNNPERNIYTTP